MADLDIQKTRVESTYNYSSDTLGVSKSKISISNSAKETAKGFALFQYMKDNQCDYVLDPLYHISRSGNSNSSTESISVTISGYPAKYKSFTQPDTLPRSISEARDLGRGSVLIANSQVVKKEVFEPFFAAGLGFNRSEGGIGLPDIHARYYALRRLSVGYDLLNMKEGYGVDNKSKAHILGANFNLYSRRMNGVHFTLGYELPTEDGYFDFTDDFGLSIGFGAQYIVAEKFAIRADYRISSIFGGSTGIGVSYCFR